MSDRRTDIVGLRQHLADTERVIVDLNRQITGAILAKKPAGGLSEELDQIIEARDFLRARLSRLEGEQCG